MHPDYLPIVAECQIALDNLSAEMVYNLYLDLLPRRKFFTKYISAKKGESQYTDKLFPLLSEYYGLSVVEFDFFMDYIETDTERVNELRSELATLSSLTEKEVKKQFNI